MIGENYEKFPEAKAMINTEGMFSISNQNDFNKTLNSIITNSEKRAISGELNLDYVKKNAGAVIQIINFIRT